MVSKVSTDGEELVQTGLRLPVDLYRRCRVAAAENDMAVRTFMTIALRSFLDGQYTQQKKARSAA
jgi:hypothetical protein